MIKNLIFDFGDVFINLDKDIVFKEIRRHGGETQLLPQLIGVNKKYEVGAISSERFISEIFDLFPAIEKSEIVRIWNAMLLDFPEYRLLFLEALAQEKRYRMFLLSNTNALHIEAVRQHMGEDRYRRFQNCFEGFYLSHEIYLRKPDREIYQFVLDENELRPEETFFVDDTEENTEAAKNMGITCWNIKVGKEDVIDLRSRL